MRVSISFDRSWRSLQALYLRDLLSSLGLLAGTLVSPTLLLKMYVLALLPVDFLRPSFQVSWWKPGAVGQHHLSVGLLDSLRALLTANRLKAEGGGGVHVRLWPTPQYVYVHKIINEMHDWNIYESIRAMIDFRKFHGVTACTVHVAFKT